MRKKPKPSGKRWLERSMWFSVGEKVVEKVATPGGGKSTTRCTGGKGSSQPVNDATIEPSNRTQISTKLPNYFLLAIRHLILDRFQNSLVKV